MSGTIRVRRIVALAAAIAWLASSCTTEGASSPPASTSSPPKQPPSVTRKLDGFTFQNKICELLTVEQVAANGLDRPERITLDDAVECHWWGTATSQFQSLAVRFYLKTPLLDKIYREENEDWRQLGFVAFKVAEQPAVKSNRTYAPHQCQVAVALTEEQTVEIFVSHGGDACEHAVEISRMIVHNLGG